MRRRRAALAVVAAATLTVAPAAYAHEFNPPNGGNGDTPLNSPQAVANAGDNFFAAVDHSQAENALLRNPTCGAHSIHPPGNP